MIPVNQYVKFIAQIVAATSSALVAAMQLGPVTGKVWVNVVLTGIGAVMVLGAGELPAGVWKYTKTYVAAVTAGLVALQSTSAGWDRATVLQALVAAIATLAVAVAPGPVLDPIGLKPGMSLRRAGSGRGRHEQREL